MRAHAVSLYVDGVRERTRYRSPPSRPPSDSHHRLSRFYPTSLHQPSSSSSYSACLFPRFFFALSSVSPFRDFVPPFLAALFPPSATPRSAHTDAERAREPRDDFGRKHCRTARSRDSNLGSEDSPARIRGGCARIEPIRYRTPGFFRGIDWGRDVSRVDDRALFSLVFLLIFMLRSRAWFPSFAAEASLYGHARFDTVDREAL